MKIQENIALKPLNTFGINAYARFFVEISTVEELKKIVEMPTYQKMEKLFLGRGSNILFTKNWEGLLIKVAIEGIEKVKEDDNYVWIKAGAGVLWHDFVLFCINNGYGGIENLSLIPGTVGAAPIQNIGAYGVELKDIFEYLEAFSLENLKNEVFTKEDCQFGYRESIFKHEKKGKYIISSVVFKLSKKHVVHTKYGAIKDTLKEMGIIDNISPKDISDAVIHIRKSKLPNPAEIGNAGSFFKNPVISTEQLIILQEKYPTIPHYPVDESTTKVAAGWLIEQAGWKGYRKGNVGVHNKQALVLVNYGEGKGTEIKALAEEIQASIKTKFGINLYTEVNFV